MEDLTVDDLFGKVFLRYDDIRTIEGYLQCIDLIRPLFEITEFISSTPGFYINISNPNDVRLSYFTNNKSVTKRIITNFLEKNNSLRLVKSSEPRNTQISKLYGGEELRFRKYLHTYTQVGLDLLQYDRKFVKQLVAEYRLTYSPQKISCRPLFEPVFRKLSYYFNQLEPSCIAQLWRDLDYWHPIKNSRYIADWAHFLVNMLLPGDWIYIPEYTALFVNPTPKPPIMGEQKKQMLELFFSEMPNAWNPDN